MQKYIEELEERNELLSNRLEAAEKQLEDYLIPKASTVLEMAIKSNLNERKKIINNGTIYCPQDLCKVFFNIGKNECHTTIAHLVAQKLFDKCLYVHTYRDKQGIKNTVRAHIELNEDKFDYVEKAQFLFLEPDYYLPLASPYDIVVIDDGGEFDEELVKNTHVLNSIFKNISVYSKFTVLYI